MRTVLEGPDFDGVGALLCLTPCLMNEDAFISYGVILIANRRSDGTRWALPPALVSEWSALGS